MIARVILAKVLDELNQVNWLLDEYDSLREARRNRDERRRLLQRAVSASVRGIGTLVEDVQTQKFMPVDNDFYRVLEEMRQDEALLRLFLRTEMRLLQDLGVSDSAIKKVEASLGDVLLEFDGKPEVAEGRLHELLSSFEQSLYALDQQDREAEVVGRLLGVVQALGGALLVGANGVAGVGSAAASLGATVVLSAAGAAISIAAGTEVMNRGAAKALNA
jgi:hypothetical protein